MKLTYNFAPALTLLSLFVDICLRPSSHLFLPSKTFIKLYLRETTFPTDNNDNFLVCMLNILPQRFVSCNLCIVITAIIVKAETKKTIHMIIRKHKYL